MTPIARLRCPCGRDETLENCCGRYHQGEPAPTPEALMRSRYSAFSLSLSDYLLATWHPTTRPAELALDTNTRWKALTILAAEPPSTTTGYVHFRACFYERGHWHALEEVSRFVDEQERWWYVDGTPSLTRLKPRRNEPCLCGSGRKFKGCCGA